MRFSALELDNWRNFKSVKVALGERAFLVGPNASGKSNLLDVFRFLADIARPGGGLQASLVSRQGLSKIRSLFARANSSVRIRVELQSEQGTQWAYELVIRARDKRTSVVERETVTRDGNILLVRPDADDQTDPERLTQTHLEQVNANKAFRELTDHFAATQYLHIVPLVIREPKRIVSVNRDAFGSDLLEQIASLPKKTQGSRLGAINRALKSVVPQFSKLELERDANGVPHLKGLFAHWRPQGAWQTEEQFSDGTLRLIGLLWALLAGEGTVLLEEPELSLNAAITRKVPQLFARAVRDRGRQIFVSTHSPDLLADPGISADEVLLLAPNRDGTDVRLVSSYREITALLQSGLTMGTAVMPYTAPASATQLSLSF